MPNSTKSTTKKSRTPNKAATPKSSYEDKGNDLLAIPMAIMAILGLYFFVRSLASLGQIFTGPFNLLFLPAAPALLVALFGGLYAYRVIKRRFIPKTASRIATIFFVALVLIGIVSLTVLVGEGVTCPISSNLQQDCGQSNAFMLYLYVNNPVTYGVAMILAIAGSVPLLSQVKKK